MDNMETIDIEKMKLTVSILNQMNIRCSDHEVTNGMFKVMRAMLQVGKFANRHQIGAIYKACGNSVDPKLMDRIVDLEFADKRVGVNKNNPRYTVYEYKLNDFGLNTLEYILLGGIIK